MRVLVPILALFLSAPFPLKADSYYIRPDGGTADQCTGLEDAAYPGSGTAQPCAWAHPFWALTEEGAWRIAGGDTLLIGPGSYKMGFGAPNTGWCDAGGAFACVLPPLPSGPSAAEPTRLLGSGWDTGCAAPPELWGTQRADQVLSLEGTSFAVIGCLEITDHSSCVEFHTDAAAACERDAYPYGDWAGVGIFAVGGAGVTLRDLDIHGLANTCVWAGRMTDWIVEGVRTAGCGWAGWNGDVGEDSSNAGTLWFKGWTVEWNGCAETWPEERPDRCWAQEAGGYGDGAGFARTGGRWLIEESLFRYNTSDGLDLLYAGVDHPDSAVVVRNTRAYGNAGNQIKVGGSSALTNVLAVGNCGFFLGQPFAPAMGDAGSGDHCRAGGAALSINLGRDDAAEVVNATVAGQGWAMIEAQCNTLDFPDQPPCSGLETTAVRNGVFVGHEVFGRDDGRLPDFIGDADPYLFVTGHEDYNIVFNLQNDLPAVGAHDLTADPRLADAGLETFDAHLTAGSPAIDSGLAKGAPAGDGEGTARPQGAGVDRGACEARSAGTREYFIPAAARIGGAAGSNWVTDVTVLNPDPREDGTVTVHYTPAGADGASTPFTHGLELAAGAGAFEANVLERWFGIGGTAGALRLETPLPSLRIATRTYNDQGASGTYGQSVPGYRTDEAPTPRGEATLLGLAQNGRSRTNIGVADASGLGAAVTVTLYGNDGTLLGGDTLTVAPWSWVQKSLPELGVASADDAFAVVREANSRAVFAYASVADQATSDAVFIPALGGGDVYGESDQLYPVIARTEGAHNTHWRTDLALFNPALAEQEAALTLTTAAGEWSAAVRVPGQRQVTVHDAVGTLFPSLTADTAGGLRVRTLHGLLLSGRVYNDRGIEGTYGQSLPGVLRGDALAAGERGALPSLAHSGRYRCNIGFTDFDGAGARVRVVLMTLDGRVLGSGTWDVGPHRNLQVDRIFEQLGVPGDHPAARAEVEVLSGGPAVVYASVADNTTGDAVFIPAQKVP